VAEGKYNFIHWTQTPSEVKKLVEKIVNEKLDNIVIFTAVDQATLEISRNLQHLLQMNGINFKEIKTNPKELDLNLVLNNISSYNPGLYVLLEYSPTLDVILKRLEENQNTVPVTSIETFSFLDDKKVIEGFWFVDAAELNDDNYKKFTSYNKSENIFAVGNTYDAIMLLVDAFEKAETKEKAVEKLSEIKTYQGVVGQLYQDDDGIFNSEAILKKIVNGKPVNIKE
jgi:ABC-type branched-subunit amino acid transport system substrate-binding protein